MSLDNQIALVPGASRGIGQAIALGLGAEGAVVVGTATSANGAEAIANYLKQEGIRGAGMVLDVTNPVSVDQVLKAVEEQFGAPGILVNNAAITKDNLLIRMKDEEWLDIIDTNLTSVFRLSKACLSAMMHARSGR